MQIKKNSHIQSSDFFPNISEKVNLHIFTINEASNNFARSKTRKHSKLINIFSVIDNTCLKESTLKNSKDNEDRIETWNRDEISRISLARQLKTGHICNDNVKVTLEIAFVRK